ncbi:glycerophosphocholine phosphodiesterase [Aspergillus chevalieri]|uniref:Glycerophosphocholine phosphodiesterase n=1 Tax=Aspergillus chevalieri TaxID=182096 RepID=A0A7R7VPS8_ASPCH|nr:glycerophosphocholine phosphodiesterase [Aspergillus chevalieri]BCR88603.1 glycerophosphocholine phosphodiesterase [Aspergillus chevalieri]
MKFGRNLPRNVVPEWSASYIKYKPLKKLIKSAAEDLKADHEADLAGFFYSLDRNLEDVDYFYNKKYHDFSRRLKLLESRYGHSLDGRQRLDGEDVEDLLAALLELRGQLRKLQWYGEVNRRGFIKITKKLDKRVGGQSQKTYLETKVDPAPFASNVRVSEALKRINDWLSILGDQKVTDDASSTVSSLSLKKGPSRPNLNVPASLLTAVDEALRSDDTHMLLELIETLKKAADEAQDNLFPRVLKSLLQRSIYYRSKACITALLGRIDDDLEEDDDINKRNCVHRLVISIGRAQSTTDSEQSASMVLDFPLEASNYITPAAPPTLQPARSVIKESEKPQHLERSDPAVALLLHLLDQLRPQQRQAVLAKDLTGRTPLHYGAQYGFKVVCDIIIEHLQAWDMFDVSGGIDGVEWQDNDGWAPLHLSVVGGHPLTTRTLLEAENWKGESNTERAFIRKQVPKSSAVLAMATKANFVDIVQLLVDAGVDINYQDEQGETALHVAARFGHDQCARILLNGTDNQKADTELFEYTYSWTPLFIACVDGALSVVNLLIEANADLERSDSSGWTAKEHAALRGHLDIARRLAEVTPEPEVSEPEVLPAPAAISPAALTPSSPPQAQSSLAERRSNNTTPGSSGPRASEPIKSFGHRYLTDEAMILVSLGTMDIRKPQQAVNLDRIPMENAHSTQLDTALSIVVSASGAHGEPEIIDLPVQDNISTEPMVFHAADPTKVRLLFDLVPTYAGSKDQIVGRGVALLSSIKPGVGSHRMNLKGDSTVPIVAANTLEVIGSLTFNFLIVTPFKHPNMSIARDQTYWKSLTSTMVIGHRGLGKNFASRKSLQLGENTIQSFIAAANLGASYVEFDVQLTKDHVPVIYHDFLVSETGIDAPVHTLTLEQFMQLGDSRSMRANQNASPRRADIIGEERSGGRMRSMSVGGSEYNVAELNEKIKHTRDFKKKGFKGNTRGNHIQAPFATLEELFRKLPKSVGFNIELKYPMLFESEQEEMDTYAVELNSFVDTVLKLVYDLGQGRNMLFSSFNPDICLLLSFKQPSIPVLFLSDSGASPAYDIRASSLQEAVRFASRWNLLGIVSQAEPLVLCPRLVRVVKESGLVCVSYGAINNEPENVKRQVNEGIDAVIVDSVLAIRKGLTEHESKMETPSTSPQPSPLAIPSTGDEGLKDTNKIPVLEQAEKRGDHLHVKPEAYVRN